VARARIVVRAASIVLRSDSGDAQGKAADSRLEDSLRCLKRDTLTFKQEPALQRSPLNELRSTLARSSRNAKAASRTRRSDSSTAAFYRLTGSESVSSRNASWEKGPTRSKDRGVWDDLRNWLIRAASLGVQIEGPQPTIPTGLEVPTALYVVAA
jgi:hypothetical protein